MPSGTVIAAAAASAVSAVELTQEIVHELLDYDPATGVLTWKQRDRKWFIVGGNGRNSGDNQCKCWNARLAGRPAGTLDKGYIRVTLFDIGYRAHRVIWLWMTGCWPNQEIDHENHQRADNRWDNLFETVENQRNKTLQKNNTSGRVGVCWVNRNGGKWRAFIGVGDRDLQLGDYDDFNKACDVRTAAELKYGYHERHGEEMNSRYQR